MQAWKFRAKQFMAFGKILFLYVLMLIYYYQRRRAWMVN